MKPRWKIERAVHDKEGYSDDKMDVGPFGLFNIDVYATKGKAMRPFKPFFKQHNDKGPDSADFQYIVGVVAGSDEGRPRSLGHRIIDACWDPTDPEADLKQAMQFLMDLVNARGM